MSERDASQRDAIRSVRPDDDLVIQVEEAYDRRAAQLGKPPCSWSAMALALSDVFGRKDDVQ